MKASSCLSPDVERRNSPASLPFASKSLAGIFHAPQCRRCLILICRLNSGSLAHCFNTKFGSVKILVLWPFSVSLVGCSSVAGRLIYARPHKVNQSFPDSLKVGCRDYASQSYMLFGKKWTMLDLGRHSTSL